MGRKWTLLGFCLVGYVLGAFGWMVRTPVVQFIENIGVTSDASQALVAGLFGSAVMLLGVLAFAFLSSSGPN